MSSTRCWRPIDDDDGYKHFAETTMRLHSSYGSGDEFRLMETMSDASSSNANWEMNYLEAAIFLEEGANNEKFDSHPRHASALPAYLLVHSTWYATLDICASVTLLVLALTERPSMERLALPVGVHAALELVALAVIAVELVLKLQWTGYGAALRHRRTAIKAVALLVMLVESIVVLARRESHFRVTRALRPIFLVDARFCGSLRRFIRQILQSLPAIGDMLALLLFFVASYALLGYQLFGDDPNFATPTTAFVSMFVLLTTANYPDVMMPSYAASRWSAVFFVSYIAVVLYVLANLLLAVVAETFAAIERDKLRKLLLHRRAAARHAHRLLLPRHASAGIRYAQFAGAMRYFAPGHHPRDVFLMFHTLNSVRNGQLTEHDFAGVYDALELRWQHLEETQPCETSAPRAAARRLVTSPYFEHVVYAVIIANVVATCVRVAQPTVAVIFAGAYSLEAAIRITASGWRAYTRSGWHCFDLAATLAAVVGVIFSELVPPPGALRALRLFKLRKRYRDIFGALVLLTPLMCSAGGVMLLMYYAFAVVGMELFAAYDLRDCCVNTSLEAYFRTAPPPGGGGYYYLNNFGDLIAAGVTLFELTVVNNWYVIMEAYAMVTRSPAARLFFMAFYVVTMVVLTIVVASVLEAFRFRIQYKRTTSRCDEERLLRVEVHVDERSVRQMMTGADVHQVHAMCKLMTDDIDGGRVYVGRRQRTREVLQRRMYAEEIDRWMAEADNGDEHQVDGLRL